MDLQGAHKQRFNFSNTSGKGMREFFAQYDFITLLLNSSNTFGQLKLDLKAAMYIALTLFCTKDNRPGNN